MPDSRLVMHFYVYALLSSVSIDNMKNIYFSIFSAILILNIWFKFPGKNNTWASCEELAPVAEYWNYARLRFFGNVAVFIIPAFIAYFFTLFHT
jgi:hypothetical protein